MKASFLTGFTLFLLLFISGTSFSEENIQMQEPQPEPDEFMEINVNNDLVSIRVKNVEFKKLLLSLGQKAGFDVEIESASTRKVTTGFDSLKIEDAIRRITNLVQEHNFNILYYNDKGSISKLIVWSLWLARPGVPPPKTIQPLRPSPKIPPLQPSIQQTPPQPPKVEQKWLARIDVADIWKKYDKDKKGVDKAGVFQGFRDETVARLRNYYNEIKQRLSDDSLQEYKDIVNSIDTAEDVEEFDDHWYWLNDWADENRVWIATN